MQQNRTIRLGLAASKCEKGLGDLLDFKLQMEVNSLKEPFKKVHASLSYINIITVPQTKEPTVTLKLVQFIPRKDVKVGFLFPFLYFKVLFYKC